MTSFEALREVASPAAGQAVGRPRDDGHWDVDAATPWYLDDEASAWLVVQGRIDLFAVAVDGGSARMHVRSITEGQTCGGRLVGDGLQVLALAVPGTVVATCPPVNRQELTGPQGEPFEAWIADRLAARAEETSTRLTVLADHDRSVLAAADALVAGVVRSGVEATVHDDDVVVAVSALAAHEGIGLPEAWVQSSGTDLFDRVQDQCRGMSTRARRVRLEPDWWRHAGDGFIGVDDAGLAVAVLPRRRTWSLPGRGRIPYVVVARGSNGACPLEAKHAARLALDAVVLAPVLPPSPQGARSLVQAARSSVRGEAVWLAAVATATSLMGLLVPITLAKVVSSAVPNRQEEAVVGLIALLFAAAFASFVFEVVRGLTMLRLGSEYDRVLLPALWDRLLRLPARFFREYDVGDLASRLQGIDVVRQTLPTAIMMGLLSLATLAVTGVLMLVVSVRLAVPAMVTIGGIVLVAALVLRSADRFARQETRFTARRQAMSLQLVKGVSKIRVAGATATMFARWSELLARGTRNRQQAAMRSGLVAVLAGATGLLGMAVSYAAAASMGTEIETGAFAAFASAVGLAAAATSQLALVGGALNQVRDLVERVSPILASTTEDARGGSRVQLQGAVSFEDLHFGYDGSDALVLEGFGLHVPAGSFTALVGESGCGKSTVLRCLMGFEQPSRGSVLLDDIDLGELDLPHVRRQFGVVMQRFSLMGGTVFENIVGPRALTEDDAWAAAEQVGLADFIRSLPMGMRTLIVDGGGTFSGGQAQRLMLARAVVGSPRIIVLDEATSALDNPSQELVSRSLAALQCTRIVVAHRLSTIRDADQIAVMARGRVVELGRHDDLMAQGGRYAELVRRQL